MRHTRGVSKCVAASSTASTVPYSPACRAVVPPPSPPSRRRNDPSPSWSTARRARSTPRRATSRGVAGARGLPASARHDLVAPAVDPADQVRRDDRAQARPAAAPERRRRRRTSGPPRRPSRRRWPQLGYSALDFVSVSRSQAPAAGPRSLELRAPKTVTRHPRRQEARPSRRPTPTVGAVLRDLSVTSAARPVSPGARHTASRPA